MTLDNLKTKFLRRLMARDAIEWAKRQGTIVRGPAVKEVIEEWDNDYENPPRKQKWTP